MMSGERRLVYTAQSKQHFYCRDAVCEFVFRQGAIPLNPFRTFDYFLGDRVDRDVIRAANYAVLRRCDELWVFGEVLADGVLIEIAQAMRHRIPIRYFTISADVRAIKESPQTTLDFEIEVYERTRLRRSDLIERLSEGDAHNLATALGREYEISGVA